MRKKLAASIMILCMVAAMLAGCGNEPEDLAEGSQFFSAGGFMNIVLDNCEVYGEAVSTEELREIFCEGRTYYAIANWK